MTTYRQLPFDREIRLRSSRSVADDDGLRDLMELATGRERPDLRGLAMSRLAESDLPNRHDLLCGVLAACDEPPDARHMAALCLGTIDSRAARSALVEYALVDDARVQRGVLQALFDNADESALPALARAAVEGCEANRAFAAFVAAAVAHRHGVAGHDLALPPPALECTHAQMTRRLRILPADPDDAERCLRSLHRKPFSAELVPAPMYSLYCARDEWMLTFHQGARRLWAGRGRNRTPAMLALVSQRENHSGLYVARCVVLASPQRTGTRIALHQTDGRALAAGQLTVRGGTAAFGLRPCDGLRPFSLFAEGEIDQQLGLTLRAGTTRGEKLQAVERRVAGSHSEAP